MEVPIPDPGTTLFVPVYSCLPTDVTLSPYLAALSSAAYAALTGAETTATPTPTGSTSTNPTSTGQNQTSTSQSPAGLSTGAKAGIGVGAAISAVLIIAAIVFFISRKKRQKRNTKQEETQEVKQGSGESWNKSELSGEGGTQPGPSQANYHEIDGKVRINEAGGHTRINEAGGFSQPQELDGAIRSEMYVENPAELDAEQMTRSRQ